MSTIRPFSPVGDKRKEQITEGGFGTEAGFTACQMGKKCCKKYKKPGKKRCKSCPKR